MCRGMDTDISMLMELEDAQVILRFSVYLLICSRSSARRLSETLVGSKGSGCPAASVRGCQSPTS